MTEPLYYNINKYYPAYPNLPYRCEVKGLHYWKEDISMQVFNEFCTNQKRKESCQIEWITEDECIINKITYKLELTK